MWSSSPSQHLQTKSAIALALTLAAGFVDIVGYISLHNVFTAHMTGETVHLAQNLLQRDWFEAAAAGCVIGAFLLGSIVGRTITVTTNWSPPGVKPTCAGERGKDGGFKGTNTIYAFQVGLDGTLSTPVTVQAPGPAIPTYFGFTFDRGGNLLLAEMFGAATSIPAGGQGAISSFSISSTGHLTSISTHVGDGGTAPCCIAIEPIAGNYVYLANNLSASIASYTVAGGTMSLVNGTAGTGAGPNDLATAQENGTSFLYVVDAGTGTVGAFRINLGDGSLTAITGGMGLPANRSAQGLAAY
jgi:hypothetical protein